MRLRIAMLIGVLIIETLVTPAPCDAQAAPSVTSAPPHERFHVGIVSTGVVGALPWGIISARLSLPLGMRLGLDLDGGQVIGTERLTKGQVPTGTAGAFHLRWLHKGVRAEGTSSYFFAGPRVVSAKNVGLRGDVTDRRPIRVFDVGYGVARRIRNGWRAGVEVGAGGGEGPLLFINAYATWGPR